MKPEHRIRSWSQTAFELPDATIFVALHTGFSGKTAYGQSYVMRKNGRRIELSTKVGPVLEAGRLNAVLVSLLNQTVGEKQQMHAKWCKHGCSWRSVFPFELVGTSVTCVLLWEKWWGKQRKWTLPKVGCCRRENLQASSLDTSSFDLLLSQTFSISLIVLNFFVHFCS